MDCVDEVTVCLDKNWREDYIDETKTMKMWTTPYEVGVLTKLVFFQQEREDSMCYLQQWMRKEIAEGDQTETLMKQR